MKKLIENRQFDEERALYGSKGLRLVNVTIDGPQDGESALKECADIEAVGCCFSLRYPLWHVHGLKLDCCEMTATCRAALWYTDHAEINSCKLNGIKALRECSEISIADCEISSPEFGWSVNGLTIENCTAEGEYFMLRAENLRFKNVRFCGKYSFQYIKNATFENCTFHTKDAFWHAKNVYVKNCTVKGEYLGWYSEDVTFENCLISGTQPLCYCKRLKLINCTMESADLCFEKSETEAELLSPVISIKNPYTGRIRVPAVGEIIRDDEKSDGVVEITG